MKEGRFVEKRDPIKWENPKLWKVGLKGRITDVPIHDLGQTLCSHGSGGYELRLRVAKLHFHRPEMVKSIGNHNPRHIAQLIQGTADVVTWRRWTVNPQAPVGHPNHSGSRPESDPTEPKVSLLDPNLARHIL
jgi:hypothetical protein